MIRNDKITIVFFCMLMAVFLTGVVKLFLLRFESGELYPAYSSFRADPLGTKALYQALNILGSSSSTRNHQQASKLDLGGNAALLYLGINPSGGFMQEANLKTLEKIAVSGSRVVISFLPVTRSPVESIRKTKIPNRQGKGLPGNQGLDSAGEDRNSSQENQSASGLKDAAGHYKKPASNSGKKTGFSAECWGIKVRYHDATGNQKNAEKFKGSDEVLLPDGISWHTSLYFEPLLSSWQTVYRFKGQPVIVERRFGQGSIVLASDSYVFSNEAMVNERHAGLLSWFIGANTNIVFDEFHFGLIKSKGIANLIHKYRLGGIIAGLVLMAILFVWKNSACFVPPREENGYSGEQPITTHNDYAAGLISLIQKNVPGKDLLNACFREYMKSIGSGHGTLPEKMASIQSVVDAEQKSSVKYGNPIEGYGKIYKILSERK